MDSFVFSGFSCFPRAELFFDCRHPLWSGSAEKEILYSLSEPGGGFPLRQVNEFKSVVWTETNTGFLDPGAELCTVLADCSCSRLDDWLLHNLTFPQGFCLKRIL